MDFENIVTLIGALLGGGGIVAFIKAKSYVRNANKTTDISMLENALETLQNSYEELQDAYRETIKDYKTRCSELSKRIHFLETEYVKQTQANNESQKRIAELEIDLKKATNKIEFLEEQLHKRDINIMRLEQEALELRQDNLEIRQKNGERIGLQNDSNDN